MYHLYLLSFKLLHAVGLKKTSVRLARNMEKHCLSPLDNSKLHAAIWEFTLNTTAFPLCQGSNGCYFPVLSKDDPFHKSCREAQADEDARIQAEEEAFLSTLCQQQGCWKEAVKDGYCQEDWDYNFLCSNCGKLESECHGDCHYEELSTSTDCYDDQDEDELCQGGCGQPAYACTCAELESLARHNADPETRGSWWVA